MKSSIRVHPRPSVSEWVISRLESVKHLERILLIDSLRFLSEADAAIDTFATANGFTVIVANTNLAFRELYEKALSDPDTRKLLVIDRAPASRRRNPSPRNAPPPFYPDLLATIPAEGRLDLTPWQFLMEQTGDPDWSKECDSPRCARLIHRHLPGVLRAHENLRAADPDRFTDNDFHQIIAFAALGIPESAFKKMDAKTYWRIGLLGHESLEELAALAPEVTRPINDELRKAPAPFCWFTKYSAETVLRACYLSVILQQHYEQWSLLLANIDAGLFLARDIEPDMIKKAVPDLIRMDPEQARKDLASVENSLDSEAIDLLLFNQKNLTDPRVFTEIIEKERCSALFRSLALAAALDNLLGEKKTTPFHERIYKHLFHNPEAKKTEFIDAASPPSWSHLKKAYQLAHRLRRLYADLQDELKTLDVLPTDKLSFTFFWKLWNDKQINRMEYFLSRLERDIQTADLLPRPADKLPLYFSQAMERIKRRARKLNADTQDRLQKI
ncbi:MAG: PglZ domain-containing protein, partial [Desulfobacterales bacterium]|nr:PglZ domain-containing protein [Desulfobacterales bacterium]